MSVDLVLASPEMDAMEAVQLMKKNRLRRLVLADEQGRLVGIVTMEDVLTLLTQELASLAAALAGARNREIGERM
jgi:CBS domain-containing protein